MLVQVPCIARMLASLSYRRICTSSSPNTFTSCTFSTTIPCMGSVSIFDRIDPSHTHSPAGVRIIDTLRRISCEIHLRSSIRCLVHEAHAHTHPPLHAPYPRAEPSDSDSYPSHRRGHSHDSTSSSRENSRGTPIAISRAKCIIFVLRPRGTHNDFWTCSEAPIGTDVSCVENGARH